VASDGEQQQQQEQKPQQEAPADSLAEAIVGKDMREKAWVRRWLAVPQTARVVLLVSVVAAAVFVPFLGAVGLWDPWETHYGEVARMMVMRRDYVFPWWENAWFFSKPPLTMWLQALGMLVVGATDGTGELGRYTEWGMRFPFAVLSITAVALLSLAVSRVVSVRAGLATGFVMATMPLYFLLTRQTVTDTPFVTTMVCAMACALIGQLDDTTKHRTAWWYAFYVFLGLSVLAKGLLGALPAAFLLLYALLSVIPWSWDAWGDHLRWLLKRGFRKEVREGQKPMPVLWGQMFRMRLGTGFIVFCLVAVPWYLTLSLFDGVDDEGKGFFYRFFIHDHLNRLTAGVHTTTPGGSFIYFIEQGGYAIFPWVALLPGAFAVVSRLKLRSASKADHLALISVLWVAFSFWLLASSATKFHHYVFPILPGLAILIAIFIDRLWREGTAEHAVSLLFGLVLFILVGKDLAETPKNFTDLFVYNYDRPYPSDLVTKPISMFLSRPLWMGDLVTILLLGIGIFLTGDAFFPKKDKKKAKAGEAATAEVKDTQATQETQEAPATQDTPAAKETQEAKPEGTQEAKDTQAAGDSAPPAAPATPAAPAAPAAPGKALEDRSAARMWCVLALLIGGALLWAMGTSGKVSVLGLIGVALMLVGAFSVWQAWRSKPGGRAWSVGMAVVWLLAGAALAGVGFARPVGADALLRAMMETVSVRKALGFTFAVAGTLSVVAALKKERVLLYAVFWTFTLCFACWFNWNHWVDLSHHWTQRDLFWRYWRQHRPGEPIAAFQMNWRGETFYSRNQVEQFRTGDANVRVRNFVARPGREWVLVEHGRLPTLSSAVGPDKKINVVARDINNKFALVTVD
jgi:4-amino-4-deoxy-L-arabinose transferase-like glycosyltransferase